MAFEMINKILQNIHALQVSVTFATLQAKRPAN